MPSSFRGRSGAGSRTTGGSFSNRSSFGVGTGTTTATGKYRSASTAFKGKINSFRTLMNQTVGTGRFPKPTPGTLTSFANWINKGNIVQTCSVAQVTKWARSKNKSFSSRSATVSSCRTVLNSKFGKARIKAIARTKTGSFMVVTSPTCNGRTFCFPK